MPGWKGTLSLVGLPRGVQGLTVRAMDVLGNSGEVQNEVSAPNTGIAPLFQSSHSSPGVGEFDRWLIHT